MPAFDTPFLALLIVAVVAFLLGSIPFGLVVAKVMGLPDPRTIGSKNIGATNMLRTGSKPAALATVLLDAAKGLVSVLMARAFAGEDAALIAALFAFLGHCYSVFLGFKGGKGVATFLGSLIGLNFYLGGAACGLWLAAFLVTRYSSLSAIMAAVLTPVVAVILGMSEAVVILALMAAILIWRHRENIARLRAGTEGKMRSRSG